MAVAFCLAAVGMIDDLRPIPVIPRLALQLVIVAVLVATLPAQIRILQAIPIGLERALIVLGLLWFINLVNFMDGLDWMTVAEMLPLSAALAALAWFGEAPASVLPIALALAGALLGFAPFNRPIARLFLGDVGSLPIGLLTGWCLIELASQRTLRQPCCCRCTISPTLRLPCSGGWRGRTVLGCASIAFLPARDQ